MIFNLKTFALFSALIFSVLFCSSMKVSNANEIEHEHITSVVANAYDIGSIEIQRSKGIEIWNITNGNLSIDKPTDRYRFNFWVESNGDLIQRLYRLLFHVSVNSLPTFNMYRHLLTSITDI